jgi:hypothetical protein
MVPFVLQKQCSMNLLKIGESGRLIKFYHSLLHDMGSVHTLQFITFTNIMLISGQRFFMINHLLFSTLHH